MTNEELIAAVKALDAECKELRQRQDRQFRVLAKQTEVFEAWRAREVARLEARKAQPVTLDEDIIAALGKEIV